MTDEEMGAMANPESCSTFDARDRLALRYAEELTRHNRVDDALYSELEQHFSREELVELCATIGLSAIVNRFHATFRTDVDESTQEIAGDTSFCPIGR
ncbi:MAG: carboxymuconolactone decarboxylase family protein [Gammaproteobacteria bacterium]